MFSSIRDNPAESIDTQKNNASLIDVFFFERRCAIITKKKQKNVRTNLDGYNVLSN